MEKVELVYIGKKPFKKDTVTNSRLIFPKGQAVSTPSDIAWRLLAHPTVWIKKEDYKGHLKDLEALEAQRLKDNEERLRLEELERQKRDMLCGEYGDIGKLTAPQLRTLIEGAELVIDPQGAQEKVDEFRLRVRDALREKIAAEGNQ